jgi:hypothetical protein
MNMRREKGYSSFGHKYSISSSDTLYHSKSDVPKNAISTPTKVNIASDLKLPVCEVDGCGLVANAGCCTFRILSGVSKGCGRNFCLEHCGSRSVDSDFIESNYDEFKPAPNSFDEELGSDCDAPHNRPLPFDGQVCQECRPRLKRAYTLSAALLCGLPTAISIACVFVYGGSM